MPKDSVADALSAKAGPLLRDWMTLTWFRDAEKLGPLPRSACNWLLFAAWVGVTYLLVATYPFQLYLGGFALLTFLYTLGRSHRVMNARRTLVARTVESTRQQAGHPRPTTTNPVDPNSLVTIRRWGRKNLPLRIDVAFTADSPAGQSPMSRGQLEALIDKIPNPHTGGGGGWAYSIVAKTGRLRADAVAATDPRLHQQREITYLRNKFREWFKILDKHLKTYTYDLDIPDWSTQEHPQKGPVPVPKQIVFVYDGHNASTPDFRDQVERACDSELRRGDLVWVYDWSTSGQLEITGAEPGSVPAHRKLAQRWMSDLVAGQAPRSKDSVVTAVTGWQEDAHGDPWVPIAFDVEFGSGAFTNGTTQRTFEDAADDALATMYPALVWVYEWTVSATTSLSAKAFPAEHLAALRKAETKRLRQVVESQFARRGNDCGITILEWEPCDEEAPVAQPARIKVTFGSLDVSKVDTQDAFEQHFDSMFTVCDWNYSWRPDFGHVLLTAVPPLPLQCTFPVDGSADFNRFLDLARQGRILFGPKRRGGEVIWDLAQFPHGLIGGQTGAGKALDNDTPIATPSGWSRFGDLTIGDVVFDEKGQPSTVTGVYDQPLTDNCYEVTFSDGSTVVCDDRHLWFTNDRCARVSRSAQTHNSGRRQRAPWLTEDVIETLRATAAQSQPDDAITIPDAARIAGVAKSSAALHKLARSIGPVREHPVIRTYAYPPQVVVQKQKMRTYDSIVLTDYLIRRAHASHPGSSLAASAETLIRACRQMRNAGDLTANDIAAAMNIHPRSVRSWLPGPSVACTVQTKAVQLVVPGRTITRNGPPVRLYPKRSLLTALADYGDQPMWDQRELLKLGQVRTTKEIRETLHDHDRVNHSVAVAGPLTLPDVALPIPPYTLGAWLGDGTSSRPDISSADHEIPARIALDGYTVRQETRAQDATTPCRLYYIEGLGPQLRSLGLLTKPRANTGSLKLIPALYLRASEEQRRQLLAGLVDTDGTVSPNGATEFTTTNEALAHGAHELALSLGYRATKREGRARLNGRDIGPKWTISFTTTDNVFQLQRKIATHAERTTRSNPERTGHRYITDVTKVAARPTRCISVDSPSQQFLAGRTMIPTHNSFALGIPLFAVLYQPDYLEAIVVDPKKMDFTWTVEFPNVVRFGAEDDEIALCIEYAAEQMEYRQQRCGKRGVRNLQELRDLYERHPEFETEDGPVPKRMLLFFDEIADYLAKSKNKEVEEIKEAATGLLEKLARLARALEINMVTAAQKPGGDIISTQLRSQLGFRMCVGPVDKDTSPQIILDNHGTMFPKEGNPKGRAWVYDSKDGYRMTQVMFLPNDTQPAPWDKAVKVEGSKNLVRARLRSLGYEQVMVPNKYGGKEPRWVFTDQPTVDSESEIVAESSSVADVDRIGLGVQVSGHV